MTDETIQRAWLRGFLLLALGCLAACGTYEEKRIRELLNEKGFGTRATGEATRENYLGGLDWVQFIVPPEALLIPGAEQLGALNVSQPVNLDGTIFVPYVGPVYALGKTEVELATLVKQQLRAVFQPEIDLQARITISTKLFYAIGEVGLKGPHRMTTDLTLVDAMFIVGWTPLANLGRIYLIRPDAEHPLVIDVNFREMITSGLTVANVAIRERDILYVPPTFLGLLARLMQRLLEPVGLAVRTLLGATQLQYSYDILTGKQQDNAIFFRF
ncbi:MAG: polysaccharide biosynthesis/export family protein [Planctomycetota bacterium]